MKKYYFKEKFFKITDNYWILDENGDRAFFLDQDFKFFGYEASLLDKNKDRLFHITKKIISLLPKFFVDFEDGSKIEISSDLTFLRKSIRVKSSDINLKLKGSFWDYDFEIYEGRNLVGEVNKKIFSFTDTYELTVHDERYTLACLALVICLNKIKDDEDAAAASSNN